MVRAVQRVPTEPQQRKPGDGEVDDVMDQVRILQALRGDRPADDVVAKLQGFGVGRSGMLLEALRKARHGVAHRKIEAGVVQA